MADEPFDATPFLPERRTLDALRDAACGCRGCDLWEPATQTVFGEGPKDATFVLVGEVPGDREDREGRPFVGPAGRELDNALDTAGIDRGEAYVTNAISTSASRSAASGASTRSPTPRRSAPAGPGASMGELIADLANVGRAMAAQDGGPR